MAHEHIVAYLDEQIQQLQQARALLVGTPEPSAKPARGRPKGSKKVVTEAAEVMPKRKRNLSPEGRKAIADAMKRRWEERRKTPAE